MSAAPEGEWLPVLLKQVTALRNYAEAQGGCWKEHLLAEWMNATAEPLLHHLRNTHGPAWLLHYRLDAAKVIAVEQDATNTKNWESETDAE